MSQAGFSTVRELHASFGAARSRAFEYRTEADVATKVGLSLTFAVLTGLAAQLRVPLPFTPVPITLQTFAVLLAGVALGARYGGLSQLLYGGLGAAGVPWFTATGAGLGHLLGPTGGYLVAFVPAAVLVGVVVDHYTVERRLPTLLATLAVAHVVIYAVGTAWLFAWSNLLTGGAVSAVDALWMGVVPFVAGDAVKVVCAALIATAVVPPASDRLDGERVEESAGRAD